MSIKNLVLLALVPVLVASCGKKETAKKEDSANQANKQAYGSEKKVAQPGAANSLSESAFIPDRVFFDFDSSVLTKEAKDSLKLQAKMIKESEMKVTVEGHSDERGTDAYNLALGIKRAKAVKTELVALGVKSEKVKIVTFGKQKIEVPGDSEDAHSKNRRSVTVLAVKK